MTFLCYSCFRGHVASLSFFLSPVWPLPPRLRLADNHDEERWDRSCTTETGDDLRFPATLPVTHPNPPYAARACVHGASITAWKKKKGSRIYSRSGQNWSNSIFGEGERLLRAIKITEESKRGLKTKACERSGRKANHPQIASHAGLSKRVDGLKEGFKVRELATTIVATAVVRAAGPQESNEKPRGVHVYAAASGPRE